MNLEKMQETNSVDIEVLDSVQLRFFATNAKYDM